MPEMALASSKAVDVHWKRNIVTVELGDMGSSATCSRKLSVSSERSKEWSQNHHFRNVMDCCCP